MNYYSLGNGLTISSNKKLLKILKKIMYEYKKNWHTTLFNTLWVD